jgi:hypothetical protein
MTMAIEHNSMVPATEATRWGEQTGMTLDVAERVIRQPYDPADWVALLNYSCACYILGHDSVSLELAERVIQLEKSAAGYINLAVIYGSRGMFHAAQQNAVLAVQCEPENRTALTLLAECRLREGNWAAGWPLFHNYYDLRRVTLFRHVMKQWTGTEPLAGKRLLLIEGGGFGDNFCFLRWAWELKSRGAHITFLCPESMTGLMLNQSYIDAVIPTSQGIAGQLLNPAQYDYFAPLLSLGDCLHVQPYNAWDGPYIGSWGGDELNLDRKLRIGFCWQAGEAGLPRPFRSLEAADQVAIERTIRAIGAEYVSLTYSENHELRTWEDTARAIRACDLIVTVDTGVAHLAGAMGRSVWVMLPGFSAWYYLNNRMDTPLYPTMRLFRNHVRGIDIAAAECTQALIGLAR